MVNINNALAAYRSAAASAIEGEGPKKEAPSAGEGFAGLVRDSLKEAVQIGRQSEELSLKGISGEADMRDVVLAVNNAEHALSTVVAVRDKVVNAYQEILKMPI